MYIGVTATKFSDSPHPLRDLLLPTENRLKFNMNQTDAIQSLGFYLSHPETYQVIALKGQWGGGKTHVWEKVRDSMFKSGIDQAPPNNVDLDEVLISPLYASLFGIGSVEELKKRLLSVELGAVLPKGAKILAKSAESAQKAVKALASMSKTMEALVNATGTVVSGFSDVLIDHTLQNRLIVLDDIERRGDNLPVVNVLGFIDFLRTQACQVLVIFNEEKIGDDNEAKAMQAFREKAFDVEMQLETSPEEAFEIAEKRSSEPVYLDVLRESTVGLGISNIRVAMRIITAARQATRMRQELDLELIRESLSAVAVATGIFYGAVKDAPTLQQLDDDYKLVQSRPEGKYPPAINAAGVAASAESLFRSEHMALVDRRFFKLMVEHIQTGNLLSKEFLSFWDAASTDLTKRRINRTVKNWCEDILWSPTKTVSDFIEEASRLLDLAHLLPEDTGRIVAKELDDLGEEELAKKFRERRTDGPPQGRTEVIDSQIETNESNEAVEILNTLLANPERISECASRLGRIPQSRIAQLYGTNDVPKLRAFVILLMQLAQHKICFTAYELACGISEVTPPGSNERRLAILSGFLGKDNIKRLFDLAEHRSINGWPQAQQIPH